MEHFIKLNLQSDAARGAAAGFSKPEGKVHEPRVISKRLNRIINRAAHKATTEFTRSGSGIFSK